MGLPVFTERDAMLESERHDYLRVRCQEMKDEIRVAGRREGLTPIQIERRIVRKIRKY